MKGTCQTLTKGSSAFWSSPQPCPDSAGSLPDAGTSIMKREADFLSRTACPLVGAQVLLLGAHSIAAIDDDEDAGVCPSGKDITGVEGDLVRDNWGGDRGQSQRGGENRKRMQAGQALLQHHRLWICPFTGSCYLLQGPEPSCGCLATQGGRYADMPCAHRNPCRSSVD